jgi:hypothetical protein
VTYTHSIRLYGVPAARHDCGKVSRRVGVCDVLSLVELYLIAGARSGVTVGPCDISALGNNSEHRNVRDHDRLPASGLFCMISVEAECPPVKLLDTTLSIFNRSLRRSIYPLNHMVNAILSISPLLYSHAITYRHQRQLCSNYGREHSLGS